MPRRSILSKDKSFPPLYLSFHQYRKTLCEGRPHFLLRSWYICSAMCRLSFVINSPEVIRNTLLFLEKNKIVKKWWWINRKGAKQKWMKEGFRPPGWETDARAALLMLSAVWRRMRGGFCQFINLWRKAASHCRQQGSKHRPLVLSLLSAFEWWWCVSQCFMCVLCLTSVFEAQELEEAATREDAIPFSAEQRRRW